MGEARILPPSGPGFPFTRIASQRAGLPLHSRSHADPREGGGSPDKAGKASKKPRIAIFMEGLSCGWFGKPYFEAT